LVAGIRVVIRDAFAAVVELLRFDDAGNGKRNATVRRRYRRLLSNAGDVDLDGIFGDAAGVVRDAEANSVRAGIQIRVRGIGRSRIAEDAVAVQIPGIRGDAAVG